MTEKHVPYFPKPRDEEEFDRNMRKLSHREEAHQPDSTFHGNNAMDQHLTLHSSFDNTARAVPPKDSYVRNHTTKESSVYHEETIPIARKVAPVSDQVVDGYVYTDAEAQLEQQAIHDSHTNQVHSSHRSGSHGPSHHHGSSQHHHVVHADDPDAAAQLAHNHALDVHAPTVINAAEGEWCSSRILVSSVLLIVAIGIIIM